MAGRAYGTVIQAGNAVKRTVSSNGLRKGPSRKKVTTGASRRPNPAGSIRSMSRAIKGPDRGAGGM
jgi:hypothetical protein